MLDDRETCTWSVELMPITLITGTPGAGKTLMALQRTLLEGGIKDQSSFSTIYAQMHDLHETNKVHRPIVVCGVEGLKPDLFIEMENALDWEQYEDGTLFLIDEAWKWFGVQDAKIKTDPRFLNLAEHRHRGMDFILTAQMPAQLHTHLRGLVSPHLHVSRKFNTKTTVQYEWPSVQANPNSVTAKTTAIEKIWMQPKPLYEVYQSATMHTMKAKIPLKVMMIPIIALAVLALLGGAAYSAKSFIGGGENEVKVEGGTVKKAGGQLVVVTPEDYLAIRKPRFELVPSSAPIFDGRQVKSFPRLFCMSSGIEARAGNTCRCVTEQNTRVTVSHDVCVGVARWGSVYDEYREPQGEKRVANQRGQDDRQSDKAPTTQTGSNAAAIHGSGEAFGSVANYGNIGVGKDTSSL